MFALFGFLFALRFGTVPARDDPTAISIRAEARAVAAETERYYAPSDAGQPLDAAPAAPTFPSLLSAGPTSGPYFYPYRPEEYVALVMSRLHVDKTPLGHAAVWLAGSPIQVDARPDRFYVRVKFRM